MNDASDAAAEDLEALFGRIADEFTDRLNRGERPDVEEYVRRHPEIAEVLRDGLPVLQAMRKPAADYAGPEAPASPRRPLPERLGEYHILREVGRGGMGTVYEAVQEPLGRRVALKVLPFHGLMDVLHLQRFRREARAAARLHHTNIVPVFGVGEQDGVHFYAMQFIDGRSLADQGVDSPGPPERYATVARWGVQAAEALAYAHGQGVLHRDIKPSNLLLDAHGTVWVTDFGLAKAEGLPDLTRTGDVVGTLRYMAPEQLDGRADARSDVYSLGLTLYELLTGRPAFDAAERHQLVKQITQHEPPRPRQLDRGVPRDLETVLVKATAKEPARRYASAAELAGDLRRFLDGRPVRARRLRAWEQAVRWCRRRPAVAALLALSTGLVLSLLVVSLVYNARLASAVETVGRERDRAEANAKEAREAQQRAQASFQRARDAVDQMLSQVGFRGLEGQPHIEPARRALLESALKYYQLFVQEAGTEPDVRFGLAEVHYRLGYIYAWLDEAAQAEHHHRQALAISEDLAAAYPENPAYRQQVARGHYCVGRVLALHSRYAEAEPWYRRAVALWEELAARFPGEPNDRLHRAETLVSLGTLLKNTDRAPEAETTWKRAVELGRELSAALPAEAGCGTCLASALQELAAQMSETGRLTEAEPLLREALALYEKHLTDSREVGDRVKLARSHWSLVGLLYRSKKYPEAEEHARRALDLVKRAVADAPLVPSYRALLAAHWDGLALILRERGQAEEADGASRLGLAELEELVKQSPKDPHYAHLLGGALHNLAGRRLARGELTQARELLDRALGHQRFALQTNPKHPSYRRFMRNHQLLLAETLLLLREPAEAARAVAELPPVARERYQDYDYAARYFAERVPSAGRRQKLAADAQEECARSYADLAMEFLRESVRAGYKDRKSLAADAAFEPLRSRPDFQQLLTDLAGATDPKAR